MVGSVSAPAFTPGPWSPFYANQHTINTTQDRRGFYRCTVIQMPSAEITAEARGKTEDQARANASLIAATPTAADYIRRKAEGGDEEAQQIWEMICGRG